MTQQNNSNDSSDFGVDRRTVLKGIGVSSAAGIIGVPTLSGQVAANHSGITDGLIGHYPLDGESGSVKDESGNGNDGINNGATRGVLGPDLNAFEFDTTNSVTVGHGGDLTGTSDLSMTVWVNPDTLVKDGVIAGIRNGYELVIDDGSRCQSGDLWWAVDNGDDWAVNCTSINIPTDEWTHLALVSDKAADEIRIYKNGALETAISGTDDINSTTEAFGIGQRGDGFGGLDGRVDDVRIYDRVLSETEIEQLATRLIIVDETISDADETEFRKNTVQEGVDAAEPGDTVWVRDGTYQEEVVVDNDVTVTNAPGDEPTIEGNGDGTGSVTVSIEADDVTVSGFTITNPDGLLGIKVGEGYDRAIIENNTVEDVGPTGRLGVTGILVGQGNHDGITINNNLIQNLDQETTEGSGFPTVNGILFDADNSDPGLVTNTSVNNNTIRDVESDIAPLGIVVQHMTDGVDINNNEISDLVAADDTDSDQSDDVDFGFTFAQGINIASPSTTDTVVSHNRIEDITSEETILPEAVKIDGDGGGVTFRANQFLVAIGLNNRNGTDGGSRDPSNDPVVDAKNNWWGSSEGPEEADFNQDAYDDVRADVIGNVDYEPFLKKRPGKKGN